MWPRQLTELLSLWKPRLTPHRAGGLRRSLKKDGETLPSPRLSGRREESEQSHPGWSAWDSCFSFLSESENSGALHVQQKSGPSLFLSPHLVGSGLWTIVALVSSCCLPKRLTPGGGGHCCPACETQLRHSVETSLPSECNWFGCMLIPFTNNHCCSWALFQNPASDRCPRGAATLIGERQTVNKGDK